MKRIICFLLCFVLLASVMGCSRENAGADNSQAPNGSHNSGQSQGNEQQNALQVRNPVSTVATMERQYLVIKEDGSLWAWGNNENCQIAYLTQEKTGKYATGEELVKEIYEPQHIMDNVVSVGAGFNYCLALKEDGTLWVWGTGFTSGCGIVKGMSNLEKDKAYCTPRMILEDVTSFSAGYRHFLAIRKDGTLWSAGFNMYGQTDWAADTNDYVSTPKQLMTDVTAVAAGSEQSYCIKGDGSLWAWGSGYHGMLGSKSAKRQGFNEPQKVMEDAVCVAAGVYEGYAVKSDNTLWGWGCGISYPPSKCPCFDNNEKYLPQKLMDDVHTVSASLIGSFVLAHKLDGSLWGRGKAGVNNIMTFEISNHFGYFAKDMDKFSQNATADYSDSMNFVYGAVKLPISDIAYAVAGAKGSLLITKAGDLIGCGFDAVCAYEQKDDIVFCDEEGFYGPLMTDVRLP